MIELTCPDCQATTGGRCPRHLDVPMTRYPGPVVWVPIWIGSPIVDVALHEYADRVRREEAA